MLTVKCTRYCDETTRDEGFYTFPLCGPEPEKASSMSQRVDLVPISVLKIPAS